jgi:penicillin-binding protein 1A
MSRAGYLLRKERGDNPSAEYIQGAAMVLDAGTGAMRVLIGGRSFEESEFNRAVMAMRQPGSAFKPFIYLAAIEQGFYPSYTVVDAPVVFHERGQPPWRPQNYDHEYRGPVTLRYALQKSLNIPTIKIQEEVGTEKVIQVARAAGIETPIPQFRSIALGSAEVTLRDLTYAYAAFANQGIRVDPFFINRIEDHSGNLLKEWKPRRREVLPAAPVAVLVNMMQSVMDHGTGAPARTMGFTFPAAGKTGTTDDYTDAWFVGFTPHVVCGVWVGYDKRKPIGRGMTGSEAALPIWTPIMIAATQGSPPDGFSAPEGVVIRDVCDETGLLATPACPAVTAEEFLAGRVPSEKCYLHGASFDLRLRNRWTDLRKKDWKQEKEEERQVKDPGRP